MNVEPEAPKTPYELLEGVIEGLEALQRFYPGSLTVSKTLPEARLLRVELLKGEAYVKPPPTPLEIVRETLTEVVRGTVSSGQVRKALDALDKLEAQ